jgi:hypothetical protein
LYYLQNLTDFRRHNINIENAMSIYNNSQGIVKFVREKSLTSSC